MASYSLDAFFVVSCEFSFVVSSIGFGGGVVAMVQPIHAPMAIIATNAASTGAAIFQNLTSVSAAFSPSIPSYPGMNKPIAMIMVAMAVPEIRKKPPRVESSAALISLSAMVFLVYFWFGVLLLLRLWQKPTSAQTVLGLLGLSVCPTVYS